VKRLFFFLMILTIESAVGSQTSAEAPAGHGSATSLEEYLKRPDAKFDLKPTDAMGIRVVGNAGDFHVTQFRQIAIELHRSLVKKYPAGLTPIDLDAFEKKLDAEVVFVEAEILVKGRPKVAANIPSAKVIIVNRNLWKDEDDPRMKLMIVFHEYLGLMDLDLNNEISSYFLTNSVLPGIIISLVSYQLSDYADQLDKDEARLNCYRHQLKHFGRYVRRAYKNESQAKKEQVLEFALKDLDQYFLLSEDKLSAVLTFKKYIRYESLAPFLGISVNSDGTFRDISTDSHGFEIQQSYCTKVGGISCRLAHIDYLKEEVELVPQCKGILKDLDAPLKAKLQELTFTWF
jgi:hypothetical protein